MAYAARARSYRGRRALVPPTVTLAGWGLRVTWRLLLVITAGVTVAVALVCTVPLFSDIATTAGLRDTLTASPMGTELTITATANGLSADIAAEDQRGLDTFISQHVGGYLAGAPPQFTLQLDGATIRPATPHQIANQLDLVGASMPQAALHLTVLAGRLPLSQSAGLEIAVAQASMNSLHTQIGSSITVSLPIRIASPSGPGQLIFYDMPARIVGIVTPAASDPFWHGAEFTPRPQGQSTTYTALVSDDAFLSALTRIAQQYGGASVLFLEEPFLRWDYHLDPARVSIDDLNTLIDRLNTAQIQIDDELGGTAYLLGTRLSGPPLEAFGGPSTLERYRDRVLIVRIPVAILVFLVLALALLFVSITATFLVERQVDAIAVQRSRGATQRQIAGGIVAQSLALGALASVVGPLFALAAVSILGQRLFAPPDRVALDIITADPLRAALQLRWWALATAGIAAVALLLATRAAAGRDILSLRRELARSTRRPLWQRLHLDLVAAVVALTGFGLSLYVPQSGALDVRTSQLIAAPLALVAPLFLPVAGAFLLPRVFPSLLRLMAAYTAHSRRAAPMLALAQMARAPQQFIRMILLLALATAFALFTLVFTASQSQQIATVAAHQVGADLSGGLPALSISSAPPPTLAERTAVYRALPGVITASLGYVTDAAPEGNGQTISIQLRAVDADTFAQTAIWTRQNSAQSLASLMARLAAARASAGTSIPAVVDARTWNALHLSTGASFALHVTDPQFAIDMRLIALAEVEHIPTVNDSLDTGGTSEYSPPGGILLDFQTLARGYKAITNTALSPNFVWLHTSGNPALLSRLHATLSQGRLRLQPFNDRRALIASLQRDPLYLDVIGSLTIGAAVSLVFALLGSLIASWLGVRLRLTSFALLRALGCTPRQLAFVLLWEQGIVYTTALGLGFLFGAFLVVTTVPTLVFTSAPNTGSAISSGEFYVIQHVLPVQIVVPSTLGVAFAALVAVCAITLALLARVVAKPALGQTLRLNED